ncbi:CLUMA_CG001313, isoform A [Clunio marinus]|uniref:CLUMA_CG001313, isoform A n=1 Tax=Clunio marinus TaxID=568069 RepID=A0A1J1HHK2_9DIPT|nr:CLUMA_CG001313, isoform A [Clunio marinus]
MALHSSVFAIIAISYLTILPHHGNDAQTTTGYDRNRIDQNLNDINNQNQFGRGRFGQQIVGQQQRFNNLNDTLRNIPTPPNDPSTFYDNSKRYSYRDRNRNYNNYNYGGLFQFDDFDPNHMCPEHWIAYRQSCLRFIKSPKRSWYEAKKICIAVKADLVNVDTVDKHDFITRELYLQNQVQNRYYISAKQTTPNNWVNDDGTQLFSTGDSFSYEETEIDREQNIEYLNNNKLYIANRNQQSSFNYNPLNNLNPLNRNQNTYNIYDNRLLQKDRVVYGYSREKSRWMYMPTYDFENNLFICESTLLFSTDNINVHADSKREIDYGVEVVDPLKLPRGPFFIKQPRDTTYDTGKRRVTNDVSIQCLAGGYPTPTYSWFKEQYINDVLNFTKIDPLTNSRYTISGGNLIIYNPDQSLDQGTYHCAATNKFGKILSESVELNFGYILEFNLRRAPEVGDVNWGKTLFCDPPTHYPDVKYYWSRDYFPNFVEEDTRVFVSYDGALYFSALESIDQGNYSCTVQSVVSDTGRNGPFFTLGVRAHPNFQALIFANSFPKVFPPSPIAGEEIRLECVAFGYPVPQYQWTRKNGDLPKQSYTLSYNRVLIIPNATVNDNGDYICTAGNGENEIPKSVNLNIQMRPNFTIPLKDQIKDFNSEVNFVCEANSIPDSNYTWYKNGKFMDKEKLDRDKYIIQDNLLTIKYLDPDKDNGMYQCRAQNQLKAVYSSAQLRVLSMKPSFKKHPLEAEIYAVSNGNTSIVCNPEAAPRPKFQWKKDGIVISAGGAVGAGGGGHRKIKPDGTLVLSPTSRDDEGVYTCVATNAYGTDESRARLIVLQEIRFSQALQPQVITETGRFLFMRCEIWSDLILDVAFVWTFNGEVINPHDEEFNNRRIEINYNELVITNTSLLDSGFYECIAKSAVNEIVSRSQVIVLGAPGMPGGVKVIDIKKNEATLEWIDGAINGGTILFYNILARTNWNKTWHVVAESIQAQEVDRYTGRKRAEIEGLSPYCSYEFAVAAINGLGVGPQSLPSPTHNTLHDKPYTAPRNVNGGGGKIGDLIITWDPIPQMEQNAPGIHYKVFYRLHGKAGQTEWASKIKKKEGNVGKAIIHFEKGNNYYTQYDVKVQAINDQGVGPESNVSVIYSAEDMPQVAPQSISAIGFNSTSINATWSPVDQSREMIRGRLIGHRLKYWKQGHQEEDAVYYLSRTTRNWALIVGLEPDTYYWVKVMIYNAAGEGPESERFLERTYRKAPQKPPSSVHLSGINPTTIKVVWRYVSPAQDEEPLQGYKIRVWEADQDMATANDTIVGLGHDLEYYVSNLTPGKVYKLRVLAYSNGGDGRMSSPTHTFQMGKTRPDRN